MLSKPRLIIKAGFVETKEPSRGFTNDPGMGPGASTRYAPTNKLRAKVRAGLGEFQAEQLAVQRMMRTTSETAEPPRHVVVIGDVTRGLGLEQTDEQRIQKAITDTNAEFTPKSQTQRLFHARGKLTELLRSMKHIGGDERMEIAKRATAWWKKETDTDLNRSRTVHFISFAQSKIKKADSKISHWITVRGGARIPVGHDGKLMGPLGEKIMAHGDKKKKKKDDDKKGAAKKAVDGGYEGTKKKSGVSAFKAAKEGYKAGEAAKAGDVTKLAGVIGSQAERDKVAKKSFVYMRPELRKIDLEW